MRPALPLLATVIALTLSACPPLGDDYEFSAKPDTGAGGATGGTGAAPSGGGTAALGGSGAVAGADASAGAGGAVDGGGEAETAVEAEAEAEAGCSAALPGGTCPGVKPAICTSCQNGVCQITCSGTACKTTLACPPGLVCVFDCVGNSMCDTAVIDCSQAAGCSVVCNGDHACRNAQIKCGSGPCLLSCQGHDHACGEGTKLSCGSDYCGVTCSGVKGPAQNDISCTTTPCNGCPPTC